MQGCGTKLFRYKGVLAVKDCREKFVLQVVHMSLLRVRCDERV